MGSKSDDELVHLARAGSAEAMEELYVRHRGPLLRYLRRLMGDDSSAEDAFQEAFVYFFRHLERYEARGQLGAYLFRIARSIALDEKSAARRERAAAERSAAPESAAPPEEEEADPAAARAREALLELPAHLREVADLRLTENLDYARIAEIQGVSEATARSRMRYALEALRAALGARKQEGAP